MTKIYFIAMIPIGFVHYIFLFLGEESLDTRMKIGHVYAVCKDPGGVNVILPTVHELQKLGIPTTVYAYGAAVDLLSGQSFINMEKEAVHPEFGQHCVLISSMDSHGWFSRDMLRLFKYLGNKTVIIEDYWGGGYKTALSDPAYRPDFVILNDEVGKRILLEAWKDFYEGRVITSGYPSLDRFAGIDILEAQKMVREKYGISEHTKVVLYAGQLERTSETLNELIEALHVFHDIENVFLIARQHPRMKDDAPNQIPLWQDALLRFRGRKPSDPYIFKMDALIAASDVVVSAFSTTLLEAAVLRKPNIAILYPEGEQRMLEKATGDAYKELPIVDLGCTHKAECRDSLKHYVRKSFSNPGCLVEAQERAFRLDGKNALRAAGFISGLL